MRTFFTPHRARSSFRLLSCMAPLLAGCGLIPSAPVTGPESRLVAAYVIVGENGTAWARAIATATTTATAPDLADVQCPRITVDGDTQRMNIRAPSASLPQRPTASDAAHSKPSIFPVLTCELRLPQQATRASVGGINLRLPKSAPRRIVILGDTGCRMKKPTTHGRPASTRRHGRFRPLRTLPPRSNPTW